MDTIFAVADRITVLDHGQVIADGLPDAVRDDPHVRAVYLGEE
jgi:branched-chain amino acid transport system ATP-binding protein